MKVAACLIAKDEGPYLVEWLSYHLAIGFDELHVYDNNSSDGSACIVTSASRADSRVRYQFWPDIPGCSPQLSAYQDALHHIDADWIAFIDADEFIILKSVSTIQEYLSTFSAEVTAVSINWRNFASSYRSTYSDELVLERFLLCPPDDFYRNEVVKSIVRPRHVEAMTAHVPYIETGIHCRADGSPFPSPGRNRASPVLHHPAQINHYVIKSREEYEAKRRRGDATMPPDDHRQQERFGSEHWLTYDVNELVDESAIPLVPAVKRISQRLSSDGQGVQTRGGSGDQPRSHSGNAWHELEPCGVSRPDPQDPAHQLRMRIMAGNHQFVTARLRFQLAQQRALALEERERRREASRNEKRLRTQLDKLERDMSDLLGQVHHKEAAIRVLTDRCAVAEPSLAEIKASTSWRATAPFRSGSRIFRRIARATRALLHAGHAPS